MRNQHGGDPKVGDKAPLIEGKDQDGKSWKLADVAGKKIVLLYFYPKDDTPGCTKEACSFRDNIGDLKKDNIEVVGVSFDLTGKPPEISFPSIRLTFRCWPIRMAKLLTPMV